MLALYQTHYQHAGHNNACPKNTYCSTCLRYGSYRHYRDYFCSNKRALIRTRPDFVINNSVYASSLGVLYLQDSLLEEVALICRARVGVVCGVWFGRVLLWAVRREF